MRVNHVRTDPPPGKALWLRTLHARARADASAVAGRHAREPGCRPDNSITQRLQHAAREGVSCGFAAGACLLVLQMLLAFAQGNSLITPFRAYASIVFGESALFMHSIPMLLGAGTLVHASLSAAFGLCFGILNAGLSLQTQASTARQIALGWLFGLVLWVFNVQVIARILFPWFLNGSLFQAVPHVLAFGAPLGALFASLERRTQRVWEASPA